MLINKVIAFALIKFAFTSQITCCVIESLKGNNDPGEEKVDNKILCVKIQL